MTILNILVWYLQLNCLKFLVLYVGVVNLILSQLSFVIKTISSRCLVWVKVREWIMKQCTSQKPAHLWLKIKKVQPTSSQNFTTKLCMPFQIDNEVEHFSRIANKIEPALWNGWKILKWFTACPPAWIDSLCHLDPHHSLGYSCFCFRFMWCTWKISFFNFKAG